MLIACPQCTTSYRLADESIGQDGRQMRCSRCRAVWLQEAPREAPSPAALMEAANALGTTNWDAVAPEHRAAAEDIARAREEMQDTGAPAPTIEGEVAAAAQAHTFTDEDLRGAEPEAAPADDLPPETSDAPSIVPPAEQLAALPVALPEADDGQGSVESFAQRRQRLRAQRRSRPFLPRLPLAIGLLLAIAGTLVAARKHVVRYAPQTASFYAGIGLPVNLRGLAFDSVKIARETQDGIPVLLVEGEIGSRASSAVEVPRLRFAVRNPNGAEIYSWTAMPQRSILLPGEQLAFRTRLASPPPDGRDVTVRFFTRHDVMAGIR